MTEHIAYEELLRRDGQVISHVVGRSMLPLLHDRQSVVVVEDSDRVPPRKGDVVLYKVGGTYILHRVLQVKPDEYVIRGDNTWRLEHVPKTALLATMTGFYRKPDGPLVSPDNTAYRVYLACLPGIRWGRRIGGKLRREARKLLRRGGTRA